MLQSQRWGFQRTEGVQSTHTQNSLRDVGRTSMTFIKVITQITWSEQTDHVSSVAEPPLEFSVKVIQDQVTLPCRAGRVWVLGQPVMSFNTLQEVGQVWKRGDIICPSSPTSSYEDKIIHMKILWKVTNTKQNTRLKAQWCVPIWNKNFSYFREIISFNLRLSSEKKKRRVDHSTFRIFSGASFFVVVDKRMATKCVDDSFLNIISCWLFVNPSLSYLEVYKSAPWWKFHNHLHISEHKAVFSKINKAQKRTKVFLLPLLKPSYSRSTNFK